MLANSDSEGERERKRASTIYYLKQFYESNPCSANTHPPPARGKAQPSYLQLSYEALPVLLGQRAVAASCSSFPPRNTHSLSLSTNTSQLRPLLHSALQTNVHTRSLRMALTRSAGRRVFCTRGGGRSEPGVVGLRRPRLVVWETRACVICSGGAGDGGRRWGEKKRKLSNSAAAAEVT